MKVDRYITGDRELQKALELLSLKMQKKVIRRAVRQACKPILRAARGNAAMFKRSGALVKSISVRIRDYQRSATIVGIIGPRAQFVRTLAGRVIKPSKYAHLLEFGVDPHTVGKGSDVRKNKQTGRMHPGFAGRRFMTRAFFDQQAQALAILTSEIRLGLSKIADEAARESGGQRVTSEIRRAA